MSVDEFIKYLEHERDVSRERCQQVDRLSPGNAAAGVYSGEARAYNYLANQLKTKQLVLDTGGAF